MGMFIDIVQNKINILIGSTGCNDGIPRPCTQCEESGIETVVYGMSLFLQQSQRKCSKCNGQGNLISNHNRCKICRGNKIFNQKKRLVVNIVPGSEDGEFIKFLGEGSQIVRFNNENTFFFKYSCFSPMENLVLLMLC